jgi:hypothetical protein
MADPRGGGCLEGLEIRDDVHRRLASWSDVGIVGRRSFN